MLAVEVRGGEEGRKEARKQGRKEGENDLLKSNNPELTGGEKEHKPETGQDSGAHPHPFQACLASGAYDVHDPRFRFSNAVLGHFEGVPAHQAGISVSVAECQVDIPSQLQRNMS